ncbi:hypothetical protein [Sphingobium sp. DC-2]|uniref:NMCC_0638 family (lipo)protein n=1 Tax=Sphingobium sp. DC-2 TaxID=1303256 RepID=UPI0012DE00E7|nr:hypothetical protein [Sphingobium sp. DC-2]
MTLGRSLLGSCVSVAAALFVATETHAQTDARAKDAFDFFKAFCVDTDGASARALSVIGNGNAMANKLPDAVVAQLQGQPGGVAWAVRSPSNAQLLLGYVPAGICEIRIAEADESSVVASFGDLTSSLQASAKGELSKPETRSQDEAHITYRTYRFDRAGKHALISLSSSDKKVGAQQHLIIFGFVQ